MIKVCVLIGEGLSERHFFYSILISKFGFCAENEKQSFILADKQRKIFWFFIFPPGNGLKEGKGRLYSHETYRFANMMVENNRYLMAGDILEKHFYVLHDVDFNNETHLIRVRKKIMTAYYKSNVTVDKIDISFVYNKIESWYIAGLSMNFPYFDKKKLLEVKKMLNMNPDEINDPKSLLSNVLSVEIRGAAMRLGEECGSNIDIKKARVKSRSFNDLMTKLEKSSLL